MTNNLFNSYRKPESESFCNFFGNEKYVYLPDFLTGYGHWKLKSIEKELSINYMHKNFLMHQSNYSPRRINVIGGKITNNNQELTSVYHDKELTDFISLVVSGDICACEELVENIIFTSLSDIGDTHGWHTDDYPIALIMGIESAKADEGGIVEFYDVNGNLKTIHLKVRDAYLMRSDILKHRVSPLKKKAKRTILNFTYSFPGFITTPNGSAYRFCV